MLILNAGRRPATRFDLKYRQCRPATRICVYLKCRQRCPATRECDHLKCRQRRPVTSVCVSLKCPQRRPASKGKGLTSNAANAVPPQGNVII